MLHFKIVEIPEGQWKRLDEKEYPSEGKRAHLIPVSPQAKILLQNSGMETTLLTRRGYAKYQGEEIIALRTGSKNVKESTSNLLASIEKLNNLK